MNGKFVKPLKSDVFSFSTLRAPQQIDEQNKKLMFVYHPDIESSQFFKKTGSDPENRRSINEVEKSINFSAYPNYQQVQSRHTKLYEFANWLARNKYTLTKEDLLERFRRLHCLDERELLEFWEQLLYQIFAKKSNAVLQTLAQLLIANHALVYCENSAPASDAELTDDVAQKLANAWVVIPQEIFDQIEHEGIIPNCNTYGVKKVGFIVYRKVEQELSCYVPGEVSRIENILAREYKERHTRDFISSVNTSESISETEVENISDTATTDRNELQAEIGRVMNKQENISIGSNISFDIMPVRVGISGNFALSTARSTSDNIAKTYAQEVTRTALERILQRTTKRRTSTIIKEFEDNNRHAFDNRKGDRHITGVYRWVDKIYKNHLVNYGKRLVYEIMIPEPANFYKFVEKYRVGQELTNSGSENPQSIKQIRPLEDFGIKSKSDLNKDNYQSPASEYGASIASPPAKTQTKIETKSISGSPGKKNSFGITYPILIPDGYTTQHAEGSLEYHYNGSKKTFIQLFVDDKESANTNLKGNDDNKKLNFNHVLTPVSGSIDVSISGFRIYSYTLNITMTFQSKVAYSNWQTNSYNALKAAYEEKLAEQQNEIVEPIEVEEEQPTEEKSKPSNPQLNRITEQREIKRIAIEMLTNCLKFQLGQNFVGEDQSCKEGKLNFHTLQSKQFAEYTEHVNFMEQAIDWSIMSYEFLPYYLAEKCKWIDLLQTKDENDLIFEAFKQCGMAKVQLPVNQGYEEAIIYYFQTGTIWPGGDLLIGSEDDLTLSILSDLVEDEGRVEKSWETRVPTTLTIVQSESAILNERGLPCYQSERIEERLPTNFEASKDILEPDLDSGNAS